MHDLITFGLAYVGYVLLGTDIVLHVWRRPSRVVTLLLAAVVSVHVGLVWGLRFEWSLSYALDKSLAGFLTSTRPWRCSWRPPSRRSRGPDGSCISPFPSSRREPWARRSSTISSPRTAYRCSPRWR